MKVLTLNHPCFKKLAQLDDGVGQIHYMGADPAALARMPCVAVVGTRKPTAYGEQHTHQVVRRLVAAGVTIVSGLAYGIDVTAHQAALEEGGNTIAVLPSDLNHVYPAQHRQVAESIVAAGGSLVSEYRVNPKPQRYQFLDRNRIIAALSDAVFIPEAAMRSGSLNTAQHARQLGTTVLVAPGRTTDPMSAGTNQLLAGGHALPALSADDVLTCIGIDPATPQQKHSQQATHVLSTEERAILSTVENGQDTTDRIQRSSQMDIVDVQTLLTTLEINNYITQNSQGSWFLAHD